MPLFPDARVESLLVSAIGTKRTNSAIVAMSATDPKQTFRPCRST